MTISWLLTIFTGDSNVRSLAVRKGALTTELLLVAPSDIFAHFIVSVPVCIECVKNISPIYVEPNSLKGR